MVSADVQKGKRQAIWPGGIPKPIAPYSPAIKAGGWLFVAGQLASDFETGLAPECKPANPFLEDSLRLQSDFVLKNLAELHEAAGMDMKTDVVRIYQWFCSPYPTYEEFEQGNTWPRISITPYLETRNLYIDEPRPASTGMGIRIMLYRARVIGASLDLKSRAGQGTQVTCIFYASSPEALEETAYDRRSQ